MTKKVPHIILTSKFTYAEPGTNKNDYGRYSTNYMARRHALEEHAFLTPEEETALLQRQYICNQENKVILTKLDQKYSTKNSNHTKNKLEIENKSELDRANFIDFTNQDYGRYIGYMMRKQALMDKQKKAGLSSQELAELARVTTGAAHYATPVVGKNKILVGYFSSDQEKIRLKDLNSIRSKMRYAQAHHSILWQDVISFDNEFLRKMGVFDPTTGFLDEAAIRKASKKMMNVLIEDEKLNNPYWTASIHRNTDNIHIHFGIVELSNTRPLKKYKDRNGVIHFEPRGRRKATTLTDMKHAFAASMFNTSSLLKEMNIKRNQITAAIANNLDSSNTNDLIYQKRLNNFVQTLPPQKRKWRWADLNTSQRQSLTLLVDLTMAHNKDYVKWNQLFSKYQKYYVEMYGTSNVGNKNKALKKWQDMKQRTGNAFLRNIRKQAEKITRAQSQRGSKITRNPYRLPNYKQKKEFERHLKRTIRPIFDKKTSSRAYNSIQQSLTKNLTTFEKALALHTYNDMLDDIESEQSQRR